MSILIDAGCPILLKRLSDTDDSLDHEDLGTTQTFPASVDGARRSLVVVSDRSPHCSPSYPFVVLDKATMQPLKVRLQGTVRDFALDRDGDRGSRPDSPATWQPIMFVRLVPGYKTWNHVFEQQQRAVANVVQAIFQHLGLPSPPNSLSPPPSLVIIRRLYSGDRGLNVQVLGKNNTLLDASEGDLDAGDLVDVTAWFDIAVVQGNDGLPRTTVFLAFDRVVRLRRQMELEFVDKIGFFEATYLTHWYDYIHRENIGWTDLEYLDGQLSSDAVALAIARDGNRAHLEGL